MRLFRDPDLARVLPLDWDFKLSILTFFRALSQGIPELLHSYAIFSHPCPILLPLASRLAAEAAATGSLSPSRMAWVDRCAAKLERHGRTAVQPS